MEKMLFDTLGKLIEAHKTARNKVCSMDGKITIQLLSELEESAQVLNSSLMFYFENENSAIYRLSEYIEIVQQLKNKMNELEIDEVGEFEYLYDMAEKKLVKARTILQRSVGIHDDGEFVTNVYRPKLADEIGIFSRKRIKYKTAIVIQGAVKYEDDFTYETAKLYRELYPDCIVILSTWENESDQKKRYDEIGVITCFSKYPEKPGYAHCSYQAVSSIVGIREAKKAGCTRVCKTRTDQRFHTPDLFLYMEKLLDVFPLKIETSQKKRLIAVSTTTLNNRIYNICDMFIYGEIDDVKNYFDCPLDTREWNKGSSVEWIDAEQFGKLRFAEAWFVTYYLEKLGFSLKFTLEDSDYYRNELFIIVDGSSIDLYWPKYTNDEYRDREYNSSGYDHGGGFGRVTFFEWLSCQK
ncbi:MAG: hypothetical protein IJR29_05420 [Butyrivibrio sp.]|nr:hypothetical protein [Butyrivibrio sp.]